MQEDNRQNFVKKNFQELDRLASPEMQKRYDLDSKVMEKLKERKDLQSKYGKLPLKPGFNKRTANF